MNVFELLGSISFSLFSVSKTDTPSSLGVVMLHWLRFY